MHTIELDDDTAIVLNHLASQQGKTLNEWFKELAAQFVPVKVDALNTQRPIGLAKDKGDPLPDSFSEPLPDDLLAFFQDVDVENSSELTELFGKVPPCFKSAAEIDTFTSAERDAWDDEVVYRNDKGEPITAENQDFPDLSEFHKKFPQKKQDEDFLLSDAVLESFENIEKPRSLLELIGKGKGCFKSTAEIDSFIREEDR